MKRNFLYLAIAMLLLVLSNQFSLAKPPDPDKMLFNSAQGKDFWIAIPPNECNGQNLGNTWEIALEIYVTSSKNCTATLEIPGVDKKVTKKVSAFSITTFSSLKQDLTFNMEVRQSEKILSDKGIWIHADEPISVYVLNHRNVTADGYLAIPITACGTDYIHLSYYDFHEDLAGGEDRGGGFIVIAAENSTKVNIQLKGKGGAVAKTEGGHKIGDSWQVTLNRGDVYCVAGDGKSRGQFDISGSRITTNKPVGFISYHKRVLLPSFDLYNGRNMLCEMLPPVTAWGKKYVTVEFKRKDHGDFFRIIASQDNTNFTVKWYSIKDGKMIGQRSGKMAKSGDFFEYEEVFVPQSTVNTIESIKGSSVWEADKPVLVMQYSYSTDWDNAPEFDPFMVLVVPTEQFIPGTVFQTPEPSAGFLTNYFNIVAVGDTNDPAQVKLQTIKLDGKPVATLEPQFLFNRIPTTNLYWAKLNVSPGAHRIAGETKFGGYIYGFSSADGYGWPAAMAINKVDETDTLPPELYKSENCGDYDLRTTEFRNGKTGDDPRQVDQGILNIELLDGSFNYSLVMIDSMISYPAQYELKFALKVKDKKQKGFALYAITDRAGNTTTDSVFYYPAAFDVNPTPIAFGEVRLNTTKSLKVTLTNTSDSAIIVTRIALAAGTYYKITNGGAPPEFTMQPKEIRDVFIDYTPINEGITPDQKDIDSLIVETKCIYFSWPIDGRGVIPKILVEDWNFGAIVVNKKACKEQQDGGNGLRIQNVGSDTLKIYSIKNINPPFELSTPFTPALPIIIPPGGNTVFLVSVCFAPTATGDFTLDALFESNAVGVDSISTLKGKGIIPGPYVTSKNWFERRVKTVNDSVVFIKNSGTSKIRITGINLGTASTDFAITGASPMPSTASPVDLIPEDSTNGVNVITVNVRFNPQTEATLHNTVVPEFDPTEGIPAGSVFGNLDGIGILPKIELVGYEFKPQILVGTTHKDQGNVIIKSTSSSADLYVDEIRWKNPAQNQFSWAGAVPSKIIIPRGTSISIPVTFTAKAVGRQIEPVEVVNDAAEGPNPNPLVTNQTDVIGTGFDQGLVADSLNFGLRLLCDQPVSQFHIKNTGTTSAATVTGFKFVSGDINAFEILTTTPQSVGPGQTIGFDVKFKPFKKVPLTYSALVQVYSSVDSNQYVLLQGSADSLQVLFSLKKYKESDNLQPGLQKELDISAELKKGSWAQATVTSLHFEIVYSKAWMIYSKKIDKVGLDATWTVTANEVSVNSTTNKLVIDASGTTPVAANGVLLKPYFMLLLFEENNFTPKFNDGFLSVGTRDACVNIISDPGYVVLNTCVKNLRGIVTSGITYNLYNLDPNPITSGSATLKYDIALSGQTKIDLVNSNGETVRTIINDEKAPGRYESVIQLGDISSGVYFIRMQSGPFSDAKQIIISK